MSLTYNRQRVEKTNYKRFKDFEAGSLMHPNPLKYLKYEEKEMNGPKGRFIAKAFIFEDVETGQRIGLPHCGLFNYQMTVDPVVEKGDVVEVEYNGRDEDDRHQTSLILLTLNDGEEINPTKVKEVQDAMEDQDGDEDDEDYV